MSTQTRFYFKFYEKLTDYRHFSFLLFTQKYLQRFFKGPLSRMKVLIFKSIYAPFTCRDVPISCGSTWVFHGWAVKSEQEFNTY